MEDENIEPQETEVDESSASEQTPEEETKVEETSDESPVPYSRFKEVIDDKNEIKEALDTAKKDIEDLKVKVQPVEEEPSDWKEASDRATEKALKAMEAKQEVKAKEQAEQDKAIQVSFDTLRKLGKEVTKDVESKVLAEMIKSGSSNVLATYAELDSKESFKNKVQQQKKEGFVPSSKGGAKADTGNFSYKDIRGKSIDEIIDGAS